MLIKLWIWSNIRSPAASSPLPAVCYLNRQSTRNEIVASNEKSVFQIIGS